MKKPIAPRLEASRISALSPKEAGIVLKRYLTQYDSEYVGDILDRLQDCDRKRHGQDDSWWLHMMYEAGPEVSKLF
jgi:hypothetical protein